MLAKVATSPKKLVKLNKSRITYASQTIRAIEIEDDEDVIINDG